MVYKVISLFRDVLFLGVIFDYLNIVVFYICILVFIVICNFFFKIYCIKEILFNNLIF